MMSRVYVDGDLFPSDFPPFSVMFAESGEFKAHHTHFKGPSSFFVKFIAQ